MFSFYMGKNLGISNAINSSPPSYPWGTHAEIPAGSLKVQIVPNPLYFMFLL